MNTLSKSSSSEPVEATTASVEASEVSAVEPRRSSRQPKPKTVLYDSEEFTPPVQRRRTETGEKAKKQSREEARQQREEKRRMQEEKRAQVNAEKLERKREKERLALERQQQRLKKQEEKLRSEREKAEKKAHRDRERQLKKLEQEKLNEQKKLAKELKAKPKSVVEKIGLTKFMEQNGITPTSSPEDFSKVLEVARKYHALRNGNAVTVNTPQRAKLTADQLAAFKDLYTKQSSTSLDKLIAPDSVHSAQLKVPKPLQQDEANRHANEALVVASVMFDSDDDQFDLTGEPDEDTDFSSSDQDVESIGAEEQQPTIIEVPELPSLDDEEAEQLRKEQEELEHLVALAKRKAELRKRNKELQEQLQSLLKEEQ